MHVVHPWKITLMGQKIQLGIHPFNANMFAASLTSDIPEKMIRNHKHQLPYTPLSEAIEITNRPGPSNNSKGRYTRQQSSFRRKHHSNSNDFKIF